MKIADRKSKMISFRVSPEEYNQLRTACSTHGLRSVSELARTAMESLIVANGPAVPLDTQLQELRDRISLLSQQVDRLSEKLEPDFKMAASGD